MDFGENQNVSAIQRSCAICNTTKTPLWRGGPAGPKSLCNACGIKYRKKSGDPPVWIAKQEKKNRSSRRNSTRVSFKVRLSASNRDMLLQRLFLHKQRKLAEEEEAAVLLMALSCGLC